jgi:S1-C subfamily serine protease
MLAMSSQPHPMRTHVSPVVVLVALIISIGSVHAADTSSGSGVVIGDHGEVLTNAHVVENCTQITVRFSSAASAALVVARDEKNDLAVVRSKTPISSFAKFRDGTPVRAGDAVVALGYPLSGLLATTANLTVGNVSALAGLRDDSRHLQISAPVQPGNSGGPLLDASGNLIGIVTAKLDAVRVARFTGDVPQNVNFALKAEVARTFLDSKGIAYQTARSEQQLSPADVGDIARPFTAHIECEQAASRSAAPSNKPALTSKPSAPAPPAVASPAPTTSAAKAPCESFQKSPDGNWSVIRSVNIVNGTQRVVVSPGTIIGPGSRITGVDI